MEKVLVISGKAIKKIIELQPPCLEVIVRERKGRLYLEVDDDLDALVRYYMVENPQYVVWRDSEVVEKEYLMQGDTASSLWSSKIEDARIFPTYSDASKIAERIYHQGRIKVSMHPDWEKKMSEEV